VLNVGRKQRKQVPSLALASSGFCRSR